VLIETMSDPDRLAEMATRARERVAREFTASVVGPRLESFLVETSAPTCLAPQR
jgi:hypothetical protein